jgi:hypothetical protein
MEYQTIIAMAVHSAADQKKIRGLGKKDMNTLVAPSAV